MASSIEKAILAPSPSCLSPLSLATSLFLCSFHSVLGNDASSDLSTSAVISAIIPHLSFLPSERLGGPLRLVLSADEIADNGIAERSANSGSKGQTTEQHELPRLAVEMADNVGGGAAMSSARARRKAVSAEVVADDDDEDDFVPPQGNSLGCVRLVSRRTDPPVIVRSGQVCGTEEAHSKRSRQVVSVFIA